MKFAIHTIAKIICFFGAEILQWPWPGSDRGWNIRPDRVQISHTNFRLGPSRARRFIIGHGLDMAISTRATARAVFRLVGALRPVDDGGPKVLGPEASALTGLILNPALTAANF